MKSKTSKKKAKKALKTKKIATSKNRKYVYVFGGGKAEGRADKKELLGGKGANLAEMVNIGLPVPPGFTITTEVCTYFYANGKKYPKELKDQVLKAIAKMETIVGMKFADATNPLLVSVRSGARASMPGMMDTILNLGLNEQTLQGLIQKTGNERLGWDSYRRFIQMYGDVVLGLKPQHKDEIDPFEHEIEKIKKERGVELDTELTVADLQELIIRFKRAVKNRLGVDFPSDPYQQLWGAVGAVFGSWMNDRANAYRKMNNIPASWGTAVNVQAMVFGNMGEDSGSGVAFTRDPSTGENVFYGEYLINAQGEDVVSGARTPQPIAELAKDNPEIYRQLDRVRNILEKHYRDMLDIEFTIQQGKLYMLQCRVGKRTAFSSIKIAVDMVGEKRISEKEALKRILPDQLNQLLRPVFDADQKSKAIASGRLLAKGLNAGPGAASGKVVFNAPDAEAWKARGERVVLVRIETSPEDIKGMDAAEGFLTARGGMTSHAALVARQMGKVCVAGCSVLEVDYVKREFHVAGKVVREGEFLSLDGTTGEVIQGEVQTRPSEVLRVMIEKTLDPKNAPVYQQYAKIIAWANKVRKLNIRANADQPDQASIAMAFGAEGIGLCRTEHMFFEGDRIWAIREMILADDLAGRRRALDKLLPIQREDFYGLFKVMAGYPVTIRLLDPPLHEFTPNDEENQHVMAKRLNVSFEKVRARVESLKEFNPMLGHRGCRLGIVYPEISEMQTRAIMEAACQLKKEGGEVHPEIMIPLVGSMGEMKNQKNIIVNICEQVIKETGVKVKYLVGTMIEVPRAALIAGEIAKEAEFFSFGTNDLTQMTFGYSRDDAGVFLPSYLDKGILPQDPFQTIDQEGMGQLISMGVERGRKTRPGLKVGICGEHGGEPASVKFCAQVGMNYVSCSPFRVPIALLAAAHHALGL